MTLGDILAKLAEENRCNAYPDPLGLRVRRPSLNLTTGDGDLKSDRDAARPTPTENQ